MFARGSSRYLLTGLAFVLVLVALGFLAPVVWIAAAVAGAIFLFVVWFFRDPERRIGEGVVSPADGKVIMAGPDGQGHAKIAIFMTPVSVHVNRAPLDGRILAQEYHQGSHVPAFNKESDRNERLELDMSSAAGPVRVRLIAGTVARRIHPYLETGAAVKKGDRIGLIAFGSRCELLLPENKYELVVKPGDWVKAGHTPVALEVES
jgi:phosphatidylserine decarboxylase